MFIFREFKDCSKGDDDYLFSFLRLYHNILARVESKALSLVLWYPFLVLRSVWGLCSKALKIIVCSRVKWFHALELESTVYFPFDFKYSYNVMGFPPKKYEK